MIRFLKYITALISLTFLILNTPVIGTTICLLKNPAKDVFRVIFLSIKKHQSKKVLLLGDSVCRQIHGQKSSDHMLNLSENQSYEIAGNYLLLANLVQQGNHFDTVALYFNPFSLSCALDQIYTYNYFVKPFRPYLTKLDQVEQNYIQNTFPEKGILDFLPVVKYHFSDWQLSTSSDGRIISNTSIKYLEKIINLCQEENMFFFFRAIPVRASRQREVEQIASNSQEFLTQNRTLQDYFENISYLPDSLYLDETHFNNPAEVTSLMPKVFH